MTELTNRESKLVALGAALGSNCVPCIESIIPQAREAGLADQQIRAAIEHADKVRQVPARKVLEAALSMLSPPGSSPSGTGPGDGCAGGGTGTAQAAERASAGRMTDPMATMIAGMMSSCRPFVPAAGDGNACAGDATKPPEDRRGCC